MPQNSIDLLINKNTDEPNDEMTTSMTMTESTTNSMINDPAQEHGDLNTTATDQQQPETTTSMIITLLTTNGTMIDNTQNTTANNGGNDQTPEIDDDNDDSEYDEENDVDRNGKPQNNNENTVIVETNPVNNIHVEIPSAVTVPVSGCTACSCDCAVIVEESCNCHAPCPCECCAEQCCERPPSPCNGCTVPVEVVTTVEIVETCAVYDKVVVNDEPQLIEMNRTFSSSYEITESELAKQKQEIEAFQKEIQSNRKGICGNSGIFGIRGDEEQSISINASQALLPNKTGMSNQTRGGGGVIASLVNYNNNRPIKPCQIVSGWSCRKFGKYPHPTNCQKYVHCNFCGGNTVYECPYEQAFDGKQCTSDWSTCGHLQQCESDHQLLPDPWNKRNYFICIHKKPFPHKFYKFRRICPDDYEFDSKTLQCVRTVVVVVKPCIKPSCRPATKPPCIRGCSSHG